MSKHELSLWFAALYSVTLLVLLSALAAGPNRRGYMLAKLGAMMAVTSLSAGFFLLN